MKSNMLELYYKFKEIKEKGWIKSMRKGPGGIGYTFETLIGKNEENFPIPDYNGIEIKTLNRYGKKNIHLFSISPDGDYLFPIQRIIDILGYPDKENPKYRMFNVTVKANEFKNIGYYKKVKINVNREAKKVELVAYRDSRKIDIGVSWSFDMLKERLYLKMHDLCVIETEIRKINNVDYFHYQRSSFYILKDFDTFIDLIEKGIVPISFKISVFKSGKNEGKMHDRGTSFSINFDDIQLLFKKI